MKLVTWPLLSRRRVYEVILNAQFLGVRKTVKKKAISFVMSFCPLVRLSVLSDFPSAWNNSTPNRRIFMKFGSFFFRTLTRKFNCI
jgi:hypothetical protein